MKAFISGASSGIGFEMAEILAERGYDLVITSRDRQRLEQAVTRLRRHGVGIEGIEADLRKHDELEQLFAGIRRMENMPDIYINNAGTGYYGLFSEMDANRISDIIKLNIEALTLSVAHELAMLDSGRIMNVASTAAFQPGPLAAVYYASKSYVLSLTMALKSETKGRVSITAFCPGPTRTGFHKKAGLHNGGGIAQMDARKAAEAAIKGMEKGRSVIIPGFLNRILVYGSRLLPRTPVMKAVEKTNKKRLN